MKLSDFDYNLPKELIAQYPAQKRTDSRLLVIDRKGQRISHRNFTDILDYLDPEDALVINDTKVFPARLLGKKALTGGKVEVLLLERLDQNCYRALVNPKPRKNEQLQIEFGEKNSAGYASLNGDQSVIRFDSNNDPSRLINSIGQIPLPPYVKRAPEQIDKERYQTIYAVNEGAVAAPTAGLHFTSDLLNSIQNKGTEIIKITLHVGYGTFKPVSCDNICEHKMEKEFFEISEDTVKKLNQVKSGRGRIFCVGTTTCRALETIAREPAVKKGYTDLFIYEPYDFKLVDCLLTNFHLPRTTLLMLVSAFCGKDLLLEAYNQAVQRKYRFYSYGDSMLII